MGYAFSVDVRGGGQGAQRSHATGGGAPTSRVRMRSAWIFGRDDKLVSPHAGALRGEGITTAERQGKMAMYELTVRGLTVVDAVAVREAAA